MATPTAIVAYLGLFIAVAGLFLLVNLLVGRFLRPKLPNKEKLEVYECGEPVIGASFVQFDLRFYVVALLFIIFDVEVAFFFPWATVLGKSAELTAPSAQIVATSTEGAPQLTPFAASKFAELGVRDPVVPNLTDADARALGISDDPQRRATIATQAMATKLKWTSLVDIGIFFAVLMVGFAYVWRRGDLDWVRAVHEGGGAQRTPSDGGVLQSVKISA